MGLRSTLVLASLLVPLSAAQAEPWSARQTDFGLTAFGSTRIPPGTPAIRWNVLGIGVFCGPRGFNPGKPSVYLYGISHDRMANGKPVQATLTVDGKDTVLTLRHVADAVAGAVSPDLVRSLMTARAVSVSIADYNSPNPDAVDMAGAQPAIQRALRACLK